MQKFKVEILALALLDIEKIADYHLQMVGPKSAQRITDKLLDTIVNLEDYPLCGGVHPDEFLQKQGFRKLICGEYVCVYKLISDTICVYRVVHGSTEYPKLLK
jgi:toxin ParE1/3/4